MPATSFPAVPDASHRTGPGLPASWRARILWVLLVASAWPVVAAEGPGWRVERGDGSLVEGDLVRLDRDGLVLGREGAETTHALADIRAAERVAPATPTPRAVRLVLVDGGWIEGDDLAWDGAAVTLSRGDGPVTLPVERVRSVAWRRAGGAGEPGADWLAALPESPGSDLLVVGSGDGQEFVECAIKGISEETVTVVLDEETIPVKRAKVIGLHWVRPEATPRGAGGVAVALDGGALRAGRVEWTSAGALLDGDVRLPAAALERLDWAAGRTVSLATLAPERIDVEPWFGGLAKVPGLAPHFAPRPVAAGEGFPRGGLVLRPRTVAVWRIPPESRRFRASVAPAAADRAVGAVVVIVAIDDEERFRTRVDRTTPVPDGLPIDVDVTGARRLTLTIDFVGGGDGGCAVRLGAPVIDQ